MFALVAAALLANPQLEYDVFALGGTNYLAFRLTAPITFSTTKFVSFEMNDVVGGSVFDYTKATVSQLFTDVDKQILQAGLTAGTLFTITGIGAIENLLQILYQSVGVASFQNAGYWPLASGITPATGNLLTSDVFKRIHIETLVTTLNNDARTTVCDNDDALMPNCGDSGVITRGYFMSACQICQKWIFPDVSNIALSAPKTCMEDGGNCVVTEDGGSSVWTGSTGLSPARVCIFSDSVAECRATTFAPSPPTPPPNPPPPPGVVPRPE